MGKRKLSDLSNLNPGSFVLATGDYSKIGSLDATSAIRRLTSKGGGCDTPDLSKCKGDHCWPGPGGGDETCISVVNMDINFPPGTPTEEWEMSGQVPKPWAAWMKTMRGIVDVLTQDRDLYKVSPFIDFWTHVGSATAHVTIKFEGEQLQYNDRDYCKNIHYLHDKQTDVGSLSPYFQEVIDATGLLAVAAQDTLCDNVTCSDGTQCGQLEYFYGANFDNRLIAGKSFDNSG